MSLTDEIRFERHHRESDENFVERYSSVAINAIALHVQLQGYRPTQRKLTKAMAEVHLRLVGSGCLQGEVFGEYVAVTCTTRGIKVKSSATELHDVLAILSGAFLFAHLGQQERLEFFVRGDDAPYPSVSSPYVVERGHLYRGTPDRTLVLI